MFGKLLSKKYKITILVFLLVFLFSNPNVTSAATVGSYTFSTEVVYVGAISGIGVRLFTSTYDFIGQIYSVEDHSANFITVTFDSSDEGFDIIAADIANTEKTWLKFLLSVSEEGEGGTDIVDILRVDMDEFIASKDYTVTSIVLDPSGLILRTRNSAREFTGSVTWTIYGTPIDTNSPTTTTTPSSDSTSSRTTIISSNTSSVGTSTETDESDSPGFISAPFFAATFTTVFLLLYSINKVKRRQ